MARSSSVSWARFSAASRAARRAQSRAQAASKDMVFPSRVLAGVGSGPDRHAPEGEGRPCGCDRALRGPDGSLRIPGTSVGRAGAGRRGAHRPLAFSSSHAPDDLARWDRKVAFDQHERTHSRRWHGGVGPADEPLQQAGQGLPNSARASAARTTEPTIRTPEAVNGVSCPSDRATA